jgi:hypothetical protein
MSYFSKSSNLFSIKSAIEEFKQVILVQNQVITTLQTALNASVLRVDALETTTASNTTAITANTNAIAGQTSSITANTTAIAANATELVAMDSIVSYNTTLILRNQTDFSALATTVSNNTSNITANTNNTSANTTQLTMLSSIVSGQTTNIGVNSVAIANLNTLTGTHTTDLTAKTTQISVLQSIQGGHATQIADNYNSFFSLNGTSLNHTTLLAGLRTDVDAVGSVSDSDIAALQSDVSTINSTLTAHDGRITSNATLAGNLLTSLQSFGRSLNTIRVDVDANTLQGTQFLTALQYQSDSIFAIDQAIAILNTTIDSNLIRLGILETTQVTHDGLIREFDQEFNDPATGVIFKIDSLTTTYNAHIGGEFLTIRQNVDDNNLILGTLSTHTTSLLTAMTQLVPRVDTNEFNIIVNQSAVSTIGTTAGSNTTRLEDLETRIEDLEAAP